MQSPSNSNTSDVFVSGNGSSNATAGVAASAAGGGMEHPQGGGSGNAASDADGSMKKKKKDPPPVFIMPDGMSYLHINRNGLLFACATDKNVSPCTVIEVSWKLNAW